MRQKVLTQTRVPIVWVVGHRHGHGYRPLQALHGQVLLGRLYVEERFVVLLLRTRRTRIGLLSSQLWVQAWTSRAQPESMLQIRGDRFHI